MTKNHIKHDSGKIEFYYLFFIRVDFRVTVATMKQRHISLCSVKNRISFLKRIVAYVYKSNIPSLYTRPFRLSAYNSDHGHVFYFFLIFFFIFVPGDQEYFYIFFFLWLWGSRMGGEDRFVYLIRGRPGSRFTGSDHRRQLPRAHN